MLIGGRYFVPDSELEWQFCLASGPGGQHVNRTESAVRLLFAPGESPYLPEAVRETLLRKLARRLDAAGRVAVTAQELRTQRLNRQTALEKMERLLSLALEEAKPRRPTRPTRASVARRLTAKRCNARRKADRRPPSDGD